VAGDGASRFKGSVPDVVYQVADPTPTVVALLSLPRSGHKGSLSFNADLRVDGTTPYVTSLSFVLSHDGNSFGVGRRSSTSTEGGATSYLHEQDAAVQDEDDTAAREGVRTGDVCLGRLDYHAEEREFRSSAHSFEANNRERHLTAEAASARAKADAESARFFGPTTSSSSSSSSGGSEHDNEAAAAEVGVVPTRGWIRSASSTPTQVANLHLNPVGGSLKPTPAGVLATTEATEAAQATVSAGPIGGSGPTTAVAAAAVGVASFEDLTIIQRGSDYVVTFEAVPYDLPYRHQTATTTDVEVEYACDFEVTGHDQRRGGATGSAPAWR
jgi:hypothetical protein